MAKSLDVDQIHQLLDDANTTTGATRNTRRSTRTLRTLRTTVLDVPTISEAPETSEPTPIASDSMSNTSEPTPEASESMPNTSDNLSMDDIHEMLQEPDSEAEEDFDEYPDDPNWYPDFGDDLEDPYDSSSNEDGYDVSPNAAPPDGVSQEGAPPEGVLPEGAPPEGVPPDGAVPVVATPTSIYAIPKWKKLSVRDIAHPKKLKPIKIYSKQSKVIGTENLTEIEVFFKFFPAEIFELVSEETNKYGTKMIEGLKPLKKIVGIMLGDISMFLT